MTCTLITATYDLEEMSRQRLPEVFNSCVELYPIAGMGTVRGLGETLTLTPTPSC